MGSEPFLRTARFVATVTGPRSAFLRARPQRRRASRRAPLRSAPLPSRCHAAGVREQLRADDPRLRSAAHERSCFAVADFGTRACLHLDSFDRGVFDQTRALLSVLKPAKRHPHGPPVRHALQEDVPHAPDGHRDALDACPAHGATVDPELPDLPSSDLHVGGLDGRHGLDGTPTGRRADRSKAST